MSAFGGNRTALGIGVLCVAQFVVVLDATVVVSALPVMGRDLGFSPAGLQWVVTAYTLAFGGFLAVGGRVADLVGSRRAFTLGLIGFTLASLGCGLAPSQAPLLAGRVLQGLAAALLSPAALALLTSITASGSARRRAVGIWTAAAAGGGATGWVLGGLLTEYADWRWVFFVNVPVGLIVLPLIAAALPRTEGRSEQLDAVGAVGVTLGLGLVVYGLTATTELASRPLLVAGPLLAGTGVLVGVLWHERRVVNPLLPADLLRGRPVAGANLVAMAVTASTTPAMFLAVLYLQDVLRISPGRAAWYFPALNLAVIAGSLVGPRLIGRFGPRRSASAGFGLIAAGGAILITVPSSGLPGVRLLTSFALMGIGLAIASVASTTVGTTVAAPSDRGLVSGLLNSAAQIGTALGLAVIVPLTARPGSDPGVMLSGMRWGFLGACVIAGLGLAAGRLLPVPERSSRNRLAGRHQRGHANGAGRGVGVTAHSEPVGQHLITPLGEHGLGVELHRLDRQLAVPDCHDDPARGGRGHFQLRRHGVRLDGQ
jgi:MFS family permease